jgi:hypothetical protein
MGYLEYTNGNTLLGVTMSDLKLETNHIQCMVRLVEDGPLHKDDIIDRLAKDELIRAGFLTQIAYGGEGDFIAATYTGQQLYCKKIVGIEVLALAVKERRKRGDIIRCAR